MNEARTPGITDYIYLLDDSPLTYHNVKRVDRLEAHDQCMCIHTTGGSRSGITWSAGEWEDTSCSSTKGAVCEGDKVGAV